MRLIDADVFNRFDYSTFDGQLSEDARQGIDLVLSLIANAPTVDAVPVVRCGECERRVKSADLTDSVLCRWLHNLQMPKNGYCCYGERKG